MRALHRIGRRGVKPEMASSLCLQGFARRDQTSVSSFLSADWLSRRFTEHRKKAGCADGTIHSLRHTFITYCLALGMPDSKVMAMKGHTPHNTISRYTHMVG